MLTILQTVNGWAEGWLQVMGAFHWQSTLLVALVAWGRPAAVLARGPLLAVADRGHQAPLDALLVACRHYPLIGGCRWRLEPGPLSRRWPQGQ